MNLERIQLIRAAVVKPHPGPTAGKHADLLTVKHEKAVARRKAHLLSAQRDEAAHLSFLEVNSQGGKAMRRMLGRIYCFVKRFHFNYFAVSNLDQTYFESWFAECSCERG